MENLSVWYLKQYKDVSNKTNNGFKIDNYVKIGDSSLDLHQVADGDEYEVDFQTF